MKFANPTTDFAFKKLFGNQLRKNLTISLLNGMLERQEGELITDITLHDNANLSAMQGRKESFVDINCIDQSGKHYIIEMQVVSEADSLARSQYYASYFLYHQLESADPYKKLIPVIFIAILDHTLFTDNQDVISHHLIMNAKTGKQYLHHLEFHYIELPKFKKTVDELITETDKWLYFMKNARSLETIPQPLQDSANFVEAFHVVEKALWTRKELDQYKANENEMGRSYRQQEIARDEKAIEIAKNLLQEGLSVNLVAKSTKLPVERVAELFEEIKK